MRPGALALALAAALAAPAGAATGASRITVFAAASLGLL